jgi:hypothetical protein
LDTAAARAALDRLETVRPSGMFAKLAHRLSAVPTPVLHKRAAAVLRADLLEAGTTIRMSRKQILEEFRAPDLDRES